MASLQPYRGNPENKQYQLINDFSGGLNTASVDEKLRDNEFRDMNNVELSVRGSLANRKGFGELEHFNQFLIDSGITLIDTKSNFFKVLKYTGDVLVWAHDFELYADFLSKMQNEVIEFHGLISYQSGTDIILKLLKIENTDGTSANLSVSYDTVYTAPGTLIDKKSVNFVQFVQNIYMLSSSIYNTTDTAYQGILKYDIDEETLTIINASNAYKPTPFEVNNIGFNVLRQNPLLDIDTQGFGSFNIVGSYLLNAEDNFIDRVPTNGNFKIVVLQIGEDMYPAHIKLEFLDQNEVVVPYTLNSVSDGGGYFVYDVSITSSLLEKVTSLELKITKSTAVEIVTFPPSPAEENVLYLYDGDYYVYNGTTTVLVPSNQDILEFTNSFSIGASEINEVEPLNVVGAKIVQIQDRLVIYRGNTIYFSEQFQYDYIPNTNFVILPLNTTDEITKIYFFRGVYIVFTKENIWRMSGTIFGQDFGITKVNDFIGCIAPDSVRGLNNNLMFLSGQGLYLLTQSYYQEGLENVKKVDNEINNIVTIDSNAYSIMYKDQYWLLLPDAEFSTLKYYFNIDKIGGGHPFVTDKYVVAPDNLEQLNNVIYSIKDGFFYRFDRGYTDFFPRGELEINRDDYVYVYRFETKDLDFGYPTHDKKFKNIFFKTTTDTIIPLRVATLLDGFTFKTPYDYVVTRDEDGTLNYELQITERVTINPPTSYLGTVRDMNFTMGEGKLGGGSNVQQHKIAVGGKGRNLKIIVEQKVGNEFSISNMGFVLKLGKVRGDR